MSLHLRSSSYGTFNSINGLTQTLHVWHKYTIDLCSTTPSDRHTLTSLSLSLSTAGPLGDGQDPPHLCPYHTPGKTHTKPVCGGMVSHLPKAH